MALVTDPGGAGSDSYASLAEADVYLYTRLFTSDWTDPETADKVRAMVRTCQMARTAHEVGDGFIVEPNVTAWLDAYQSQPVQVLGAVAKPGLYYLKGATTVLEILSEAGGASIEGVNEVRITRGGEEGDVTVVPYEDLLGRGEGNLKLKGGDIVFVPESLVTVMGQVNKPGDISLRDDLTVSDCIAAAGGAHETANLGRVWILRGEEGIRVNVRKVLAGKAENVRVLAGDRIFVGESAF